MIISSQQADKVSTHHLSPYEHAMHAQAIGDHGRLGLFCALDSRATESGSDQGRVICQRIRHLGIATSFPTLHVVSHLQSLDKVVES